MEADARQPQLVVYPVDLRQGRRAVGRLGDADRDREAVGPRVAVCRDPVVDPTGVRDPVGAQIAVTGDHDCLGDVVAVHHGEPRLELHLLVLRRVHPARRVELAPERRERVADVVMDVEHREAMTAHPAPHP